MSYRAGLGHILAAAAGVEPCDQHIVCDPGRTTAQTASASVRP